jgi:hypothetical protein
MSIGLLPRPMKNPNARAIMNATTPTTTSMSVSLGKLVTPPLVIDVEYVALFL